MIAVFATLVAAIVAGSYAISTTNEQIKAQGEQLRAQNEAQEAQDRAKVEADKEAAKKAFVRNQLQAASTILINDSALLSQQENDVLVLVTGPDADFSSDLLIERKNKMIDQFAKLNADLANVLVLNYSSTNAAAQRLFDYHDGITDELTREDMPIWSDDVPPESPEYSAATDKVADEIADLNSPQSALVSALQNDLA